MKKIIVSFILNVLLVSAICGEPSNQNGKGYLDICFFDLNKGGVTFVLTAEVEKKDAGVYTLGRLTTVTLNQCKEALKTFSLKINTQNKGLLVSYDNLEEGETSWLLKDAGKYNFQRVKQIPLKAIVTKELTMAINGLEHLKVYLLEGDGNGKNRVIIHMYSNSVDELKEVYPSKTYLPWYSNRYDDLEKKLSD